MEQKFIKRHFFLVLNPSICKSKQIQKVQIILSGSQEGLVTAYYESMDQLSSLTVTFSTDPHILGVSGVIRHDENVLQLVRCSTNNDGCIALVEEESKNLEEIGLDTEELEVNKFLCEHSKIRQNFKPV